MRTVVRQLLLLLTLPILAAEQPGVQVWRASELDLRANGLKLNQYKQGVERLGNWGTHSAILEHLEDATPAEVHATLADVFFIVAGEATLVSGGTIVDATNSSTDEIRGKSINNGTSRPLARGDIAYIPAKTPHLLKVDAGKKCTYFIFKVRAD